MQVGLAFPRASVALLHHLGLIHVTMSRQDALSWERLRSPAVGFAQLTLQLTFSISRLWC